MGPEDRNDQQEEIVLQVPATDEYASIIRVAAASLALRLEAAISRIDDLRLAIDEALILLLGAATGATAIQANLRITDVALQVQLTPVGQTSVTVSEPSRERFVKISAGLVDDWEISDDPAHVLLTLLR